MEKTKITLGFSPCPNDCFMFDALIHGKIDTGGLEFEPVIEDVETLNRMAFAGKLDVSKLSYHAFAHLTKTYQLLTSGSALGFNCGPLLIALPQVVEKIKKTPEIISSLKVAIPGKYTTANFLLSLAYLQLQNKTEMIFSEVENAVLSGKTDLGLIIHENRFTYQQKGLVKITDLGEWWETETKTAIPLGGIVVNRNIPAEKKLLINELIKQSVEYAFANTADVMGFVKQHAQEMDEKVMKQHIDLYVNEYSKDLGEIGRKAVNILFDKAVATKVILRKPEDLFIQ
ncbi:MAG TPA: 1,4-dihydroxy-6-naphthoate synthase [Bacteroidia bacterium]|jgi:1,4-dihydroxy-6-naphthoate synthase|nr:1,4-dihydroxy-6-naphthoate synthase [Bacteroidia bacterium]